MYTQCPQCQAVFQITADHLKAAGGDVRCGQCLTVFNALDRLSEELPTQAPAVPEKPPAEEWASDHAEPIADWAPEPEFDAEAALDALPLRDVDTTVAHLDEYLATEDVVETGPEPIANLLPETTVVAPEAIILETESGVRSEAIPDEPLGEARKSRQVPAVILEDLAREKAEHLRPSSMPWAVGSLALMLVFVAQAVYFARNDLARDPQLRPWLEMACAYVGCTINQPAELGQIEILGWDIRSHPRAAKALVASTTLINNAQFAQPFPLLELRFSDMTGTVLAQRRFKPREYLPAGTNFQAGMAPDTPVFVELELMDPGSSAVNFEFHAVMDPRAASQGS